MDGYDMYYQPYAPPQQQSPPFSPAPYDYYPPTPVPVPQYALVRRQSKRRRSGRAYSAPDRRRPSPSPSGFRPRSSSRTTNVPRGPYSPSLYAQKPIKSALKKGYSRHKPIFFQTSDGRIIKRQRVSRPRSSNYRQDTQVADERQESPAATSVSSSVLSSDSYKSATGTPLDWKTRSTRDETTTHGDSVQRSSTNPTTGQYNATFTGDKWSDDKISGLFGDHMTRSSSDSPPNLLTDKPSMSSVYPVACTAGIMLLCIVLLYGYVGMSNDMLRAVAAQSRVSTVAPNLNEHADHGNKVVKQAKAAVLEGPMRLPPRPKNFAANNDNSAGETRKTSIRYFCQSRFCHAQADYLALYLNWSMDPCDNFYDFVCNKNVKQRSKSLSSDVALVDHMERRLYRILREEIKTQEMSSRASMLGFLDTCFRQPDGKVLHQQLTAMLEHVGIGNWPYKNNRDKIDVWVVVAKLQREFGLDTILKVDIEEHPNENSKFVVTFDEPSILIGQYGMRGKQLPRWYNEMISTAVHTVRPINFEKDVVMSIKSFSEKVAEITTTRGENEFVANRYRLSSVKNYDVFSKYLQHVLKDIVSVQESTSVMVKSDKYMKALKALLQVTKSSDLLNYLGFRLIVHLSPFMDSSVQSLASVRMRDFTRQLGVDVWPRWKRCIRLLERPFQAQYMRLYTASAMSNADLSRVVSFISDVKGSLVISLNRLNWMSALDQAKSKNMLANVQIKMLLEEAVNEMDRAEAEVAEVVPGNLLDMYRRFVHSDVTRRWQQTMQNLKADQLYRGSIFETRPIFSSSAHTVYVPIGMIDTSEGAQQEERFAVQVPRLAVRTVAALLQAIHHRSYSFGQLEWNTNTSRAFSTLQYCLNAEYSNLSNSLVSQKLRVALTAVHNFMENAAIRPAYDIYAKYLRDNKVNINDVASLSEKQWDARHLFFVFYAASLCEPHSSEMVRRELEEDIFTASQLRVNVPLRNSAEFYALWKCPAASAMNPAQKCTIWHTKT